MTREVYEIYLNKTVIPKPLLGEGWVIGGKHRSYLAKKKRYGTAMRRFDPIRFEALFQEWVKNYHQQKKYWEKRREHTRKLVTPMVPTLDRIEKNIYKIMSMI